MNLTPKKRLYIIISLALPAILILYLSTVTKQGFVRQFSLFYTNQTRDQQTVFYKQLAAAAEKRTSSRVKYNAAYVSIDYPDGDVPPNTGVCTDLIIRSYRQLEIDLQQKIHQDIKEHFWQYPKIWRLMKPDTNIDHRRVPNLMIFFKRHGISLPKSNKSSDYHPGDIVCWDLGAGITHIGLVSSEKAKDTGNYKIIHNIDSGPKAEDVLFNWQIIGHFQYR